MLAEQVQPTIRITTNEKITAFAAHNHNNPPALGQGDIVFMRNLYIDLKQGIQFTRISIPGVVFTLGPIGTQIQPVNSKATIPAGTEYIVRNDPIGIIKKTEVNQEFLLEVGTLVTIPKDTVFHIGNEEEKFTKDTIVSL